jgi:hypothetical protein
MGMGEVDGLLGLHLARRLVLFGFELGILMNVLGHEYLEDFWVYIYRWQ